MELLTMINNNTPSFQSLKNVYSPKLFYKTEEKERKIRNENEQENNKNKKESDFLLNHFIH